MGHDAGAQRSKGLADRDQRAGIGCDAAPMLARVDLDQNAQRNTLGFREGSDGACRFEVVGDQLQVHAAPKQGRHALQLRRNDADGIEQVAEPGIGQAFRFGQGRNGKAARLALDREPRDVHRFCRLQVRAQRQAAAAHRLRHGREVRDQA